MLKTYCNVNILVNLPLGVYKCKYIYTGLIDWS